MSGIYTSGLQEILRGNVDLINDDITVLLTSGYVPDFDTDTVQDDILEESQIIEISLLGKTLDGTKYLADDIEITGQESKSVIDGLVVLKNTSDYETSHLVSFYDGFTPFLLDGTLVTIQWDRTPEGNGIFRLA